MMKRLRRDLKTTVPSQLPVANILLDLTIAFLRNFFLCVLFICTYNGWLLIFDVERQK